MPLLFLLLLLLLLLHLVTHVKIFAFVQLSEALHLG